VLRRKLSLHGGGWMWRPLVDVEDVAAFHVSALAAPVAAMHGEIFNVLAENYQIRQLAMLVAGRSVSSIRRAASSSNRRRSRRSCGTTA